MNYLKIGKASDLTNAWERRVYRALEIFPGALTWTTLFLAILLSWKRPLWVAYFILLFVIFWFFRALYLAFHLRAGFKKMKENKKIDWFKRLEEENLDWQKIYHLVILPMSKEPLEVVRETFLSLQNSDYPKERMMVVLSLEERKKDTSQAIAQKIAKEFENAFFKLIITWHPANLSGEVIGHGANDAWATGRAQEFIDQLSLPYENVIVSSFDIDTCVYPKYFSCLAYHYLVSAKPTRTSFQPIPLYHNNIWQAPILSKIFSFSASFWQMINQERPEKMITFSSHSMSFKALADVGFKQTNVISDDSRIFWQCFFHYDGDYRVQPLYYPISMDANIGKNLWRTFFNLYQQQKRWAYGVGDIPYFLWGFIKNKRIPLQKKFSLGAELIEGHWSWAAASVLIFSLGWLPLVLGGPDFSQSLFSYNLPKLVSWIMTFAMVGLLVSIYYSLILLPPKPAAYRFSQYVFFALGWLFLPLGMLLFTSLPAIDAQTRWILGRHLRFWNAPKQRKSQ